MTALVSAATIVPLIACIVTLYLYAYAENQTPLRTGLLITAGLWIVLAGTGTAFVGVDRANRSEFLALRGRVATLETDLADAKDASHVDAMTDVAFAGVAGQGTPGTTTQSSDRPQNEVERGPVPKTPPAARQSTERQLQYLKDALGMTDGEAGSS